MARRGNLEECVEQEIAADVISPVLPVAPASGNQAPEPEAGPVKRYFLGEYCWYDLAGRSRLTGAIKIAKHYVLISSDLAREASLMRQTPVRIGVDPKRRLVTIVRVDESKSGLHVSATKGATCICSKGLVRWLEAQGVPAGRHEAWWQEQTRSIVAKWGGPTAEAPDGRRQPDGRAQDT